MKELKFSYNWNKKLDCQAFTTIRLSGSFDIGDTVAVKQTTGKNTIDRGIAVCIGKKKMRLSQINDYIAYLDTGYDVEECKNILKRMYKNIDWENAWLYFYLFKYKRE